jgi:hypothetical protein
VDPEANKYPFSENAILLAVPFILIIFNYSMGIKCSKDLLIRGIPKFYLSISTS